MLCLPTSDEDGLITRVLSEIDIVQQSSNSMWNSMTVIVHTEDDDLFLPTGNTSTISYFDNSARPNVSLTTLSSSNPSATNVSNEMIFHNDNNSTIVTDSVEEVENVEEAEEIEKAERKQILQQLRNKSKITHHRFLPPRNLSSTFLERLMTITPLDYRYDQVLFQLSITATYLLLSIYCLSSTCETYVYICACACNIMYVHIVYTTKDK